MEGPLLFLLVFSVIAIVILLATINPFYLIRESEVGLVEKKIIGKSLTPGRVIATGEQGLQARVLPPGLHFLPKPFFKVTRIPITEVPQGQMALVTAIDGAPLKTGQLFAESAEGHTSFQDGEAFLRRGGQKGPQLEVLTPGRYRINTYLFNVQPATMIEIPQGKVGIVTATDGAMLQTGQLLGQHVQGHQNFQNSQVFLRAGGQKGPQVDILTPGQYRINTQLFRIQLADAVRVKTGEIGLVSALDGSPLREEQILGDTVTGHNDFQDGQAFLNHAGQRGPQLDILKPGMYYVNPLLFQVTVQEATVINIGEVGVVRSNVGILPPVGEDGRTPDLVDEGFRGVLKSVLEPNTYYLNPIAYVVFPISTLNITIDWNTTNRATPLDSITVKSRDGFSFPVDVKVVIRVLKEKAPVVVSKIGSIQNAIDRVIHPAIGATFRNNAERCDALDFLNNRSLQQANAREVTTQMLREYGIETVDVLIGDVGIPETLLKTQTDRFLAREREKTYREQKTAEETRSALENATASADQQKHIVAAQAAVEIAKSQAAAAIATAEGEAKQITLRAEANQHAYKLLISEIGREGVLTIEMLKLIKEGKIKITPDVFVSGGGEGKNTALSALAATMLNGQVTALNNNQPM
ncbi:MAG TPA: SPFH domain-containing protein, partial [Acidobacteriota bacterium]|nr:SPFH domain-containing protein [Acidobacteriota bacterium]